MHLLRRSEIVTDMDSTTRCSGLGRLQEEVRPLQLHPRGDTSGDPVVDPLGAAFGISQKLCHLRRAAERMDQFSVFHAPIKHSVYASVNTACINGLFSSPTIHTMTETSLHASMRRLLAAAREATDNAALDFPDIGRKLDETSATITNWKKRGVSVLGAIKAEQAYGCSPSWVLHGKMPARPKPPAVKSFKDRAPPSSSQWATLDAIDSLPEETRQQRIEAILEEGKKWKAISDELVARAKGGGRS